LLIGLGVLALGGLIYFLMRKKGTSSTSVIINVNNYSASDYAPLTDAQIKAKIDEINKLVGEVGVDEAIAQLQMEIDALLNDGFTRIFGDGYFD
jgi:HAMP domain-containing protein